MSTRKREKDSAIKKPRTKVRYIKLTVRTWNLLDKIADHYGIPTSTLLKLRLDEHVLPKIEDELEAIKIRRKRA